MYEDAGLRAVIMVVRHPGVYDRKGLASELRASYLNDMVGDMGEHRAITIVDTMVESGKIIASPRPDAFTGWFKFLYPGGGAAANSARQEPPFSFPSSSGPTAHGFSHGLPPGGFLAISLAQVETQYMMTDRRDRDAPV